MMRRIVLYLALVAAAAATAVATGRADMAVPQTSQAVAVRHEVSGDRFQYEVGDDDTSRAIAARFGEPDTIILLDGGEPEPGAKITVDNRHVAAAAIGDGVVINVPQRMLFVFRAGQLAAAWP